ncbi:putative reverse transcriptase domain-containing protein [Tanacetum coccineum]
MTTANQGISVVEIVQIVAQRVANAIEAIAIYETKTSLARMAMSQTKWQGEKVAENANNKRKRKVNQNGSTRQQQNKECKVVRPHTAGPSNKKKYVGSLPLYAKCNYHHNGQCAPKCTNCKKVGHLTKDCWRPINNNRRTITCYECGNQGHYRSDGPVLRNQEVRDAQLTGPAIIHETTEKIVQIKAESKPLMTDRRAMKTLGVNQWYVGPFKVIERVETVAYKLELPQQLSRVHNTFHVSNLKKCLSDESLVIPLEELCVDDKLHFVEEPVEVMDREIKQLKRSRIPIVKVRWNSKRGTEFT